MVGQQTYASCILIPILFVGGLLIAGCGPSGEQGLRVVEDDLGRRLHLQDTISRVVTLAPNLTEIVFAAGAGHSLVGVGRPDDFPPAVDTLPRYSVYPVEFEAVAALEPDLALASDQVNGLRDAETLEALDIPTYFIASSNLDEIFEGILTAGVLLGTERAAESTVDSLRQHMQALAERTSTVSERPLTLFLISDETLFSFGRESYMHDLIELAGGRSATVDIDADAPILSEEFVLSTRPDVIIGPWGDDYDARRLIRNHPTWDVVPAIQNGRVYSVDASLVERPGPRLIEGAWVMARKIHPELFQNGVEYE